jgi:hypothetical protein
LGFAGFDRRHFPALIHLVIAAPVLADIAPTPTFGTVKGLWRGDQVLGACVLLDASRSAIG